MDTRASAVLSTCVHRTCAITYVFYVAYVRVRVRDVTTTVIIGHKRRNYPYVCVEMLPPRPAPVHDLCLLESSCFFGWPVEAARKKKVRAAEQSVSLFSAYTDRGLPGLKVVWTARWLEILIALITTIILLIFLSAGSSDFSKTTYLWMENRVI